MRILVVEDDPMLRQGLVDLLTADGHEAELVVDGHTAVERGREESWELVLLDVMLPGLDGIEVCRRLRLAKPTLPILMLTARGAEDDKVRGLRAGADDYVTKPFGVKELLARIEAMERRARHVPAEAEILEVDGCVLDLGRCTVRRGDREDSLTAREVGILRWLYRHRERSVPRSELLEQVWGTVGTLQTRTVDMTIAKLRQKVEEDAASPRIIRTVTGVGYAWAAGDARS